MLNHELNELQLIEHQNLNQMKTEYKMPRLKLMKQVINEILLEYRT